MSLNFILEAERNVEHDSKEEGETDGDSSIFQGVQSLKISWFVDGDVPVNSHADDDVD